MRFSTILRTGTRLGRLRPGERLPGRPAVQVSDVQCEFADRQEHVDLSRPRYGLPAGQAVVGGPVVQARVAVRQRIRAGQDRDRAAIPVSDVEEAITRVHPEEWAWVVAALTRRFGDLDIAEEAAAEAFATAVERWLADGVPPNPR
jgi:hypothetical protein